MTLTAETSLTSTTAPSPPPAPAVPGALPSRLRPEAVAALLVGGSLALHFLLAGYASLSPQEAYYWQWARHLDWSYFDHPPLAAWTIRLTTAILGHTERGVRLAAAVHGALFAVFFFLAGRRLFGARAALLALAAALVTPLFAVGQVVITPDAPLLAGWAAALYFTIRALETGRGAWLLAAGAAVGFATLGKYTGWLLAPQILLALLLDRRGRRLLVGPWPYLALAVAAALFSPVLAWNARHGWVSFGFQLGWRGAGITWPSPRRFGRFIGLQAAQLTPIMWALLWAALAVAARRGRERAYRLCALFGIPPLALCLGLSPFMWVKGNWPAVAYPAALLAAAGIYLEAPQARRRLAAAALGLALSVTVYLHLAMAFPNLPFPAPAKDDVVTGWTELAARVEGERSRLPAPAAVVGCTYKSASELAFYLPGQPETYSQNALGEAALQYDFWGDRRALAGREAIVVLDRREWRNCMTREELCRPLEELSPLTVRRGSRAVTTFRLWRCRFAEGAAR